MYVGPIEQNAVYTYKPTKATVGQKLTVDWYLLDLCTLPPKQHKYNSTIIKYCNQRS